MWMLPECHGHFCTGTSKPTFTFIMTVFEICLVVQGVLLEYFKCGFIFSMRAIAKFRDDFISLLDVTVPTCHVMRSLS